MKTAIVNAVIVNEGRKFHGTIVIDGDIISEIIDGNHTPDGIDHIVDAAGCLVLPGVIDTHVHFREPGLTQKADIESESRAAACGGVTSFFDMPNTVPQTTTLEAFEEKHALARQKSHVNYAFFFGATNTNHTLFSQLDPHRTPGIKLFMGSSTGNMLVDREEALNEIFRCAPLPIVAHCEDTTLINENMKAAKARYGDDPPIACHPQIRSEEACYRSTALAVALAERHHARLHVAHLTTARELQLFGHNENITAEAVVAHLFFCNDDYLEKQALIKCNPSVKTAADREALRKALNDGRIATIATDHAPHLLSEKQGGAAKAMSGMPMIQFSLVTMLELADQGVLSMERLVQLMCHRPAQLFNVSQRGFLREGYKADVVIVKRGEPWTVDTDCIQSKCKWSPMTGHTYQWRVRDVFCNGRHIISPQGFDDTVRGEAVRFR